MPELKLTQIYALVPLGRPGYTKETYAAQEKAVVELCQHAIPQKMLTYHGLGAQFARWYNYGCMIDDKTITLQYRPRIYDLAPRIDLITASLKEQPDGKNFWSLSTYDSPEPREFEDENAAIEYFEHFVATSDITSDLRSWLKYAEKTGERSFNETYDDDDSGASIYYTPEYNNI